MCSGCSHHQDLVTVQNWKPEEVDTLIEYRIHFEEFRSTATRSEVYDELKKNYGIAVRKIKRGGSPSLNAKRPFLRGSVAATGGETAKKQRTAIDPKVMRQVMDELAIMSPPQLLQINKKVAELLDKKYPWFLD